MQDLNDFRSLKDGQSYVIFPTQDKTGAIGEDMNKPIDEDLDWSLHGLGLSAMLIVHLIKSELVFVAT
jgi:hypothetical protein